MADNPKTALPAPPPEITQPIPSHTGCPEINALRAKRDAWIASAAGQGLTSAQIAEALNMSSSQNVQCIISRWRCRHGGLPNAAPPPKPEPAPEARQPDPDKHLVEMPASPGFSQATTTVSRPRAPWEDQHSSMACDRPETAPRTLPNRIADRPAPRTDVNIFIAALRAELARQKEARHG